MDSYHYNGSSDTFRRRWTRSPPCVLKNILVNIPRSTTAPQLSPGRWRSGHRCGRVLPRSTRGPFHTGDLVCFYRKHQGNKKGGGRWYGPARVVGSEGRSTLWIVHGGIPMTVSSEQCRHSTGEEAGSKRLVELRPSCKRRRKEAAPPGLEDGFAFPFGDDLTGTPGGSSEQRIYVHAGQDSVVAPDFVDPSCFRKKADIFEGMSDTGNYDVPVVPTYTTSTAPPLPPPGLLPLPENETVDVTAIPVGGPDVDEDLNSADEPETEAIPPSRRQSGEEFGTLQEALRRGTDTLDATFNDSGNARGRRRRPPVLLHSLSDPQDLQEKQHRGHSLLF